MSILLVIYRCTYKQKTVSILIYYYSFNGAYKVFEVNEYS
jgi:hypothetical protein